MHKVGWNWTVFYSIGIYFWLFWFIMYTVRFWDHQVLGLINWKMLIYSIRYRSGDKKSAILKIICSQIFCLFADFYNSNIFLTILLIMGIIRKVFKRRFWICWHFLDILKIVEVMFKKLFKFFIFAWGDGKFFLIEFYIMGYQKNRPEA